MFGDEYFGDCKLLNDITLDKKGVHQFVLK